MKFPVLICSLLAACGSVTESDEPEPSPEELATAICEGMVLCLSSVVTVEECVEAQLSCRDLLNEPSAWDDHMQACIELGSCQEHGDNPDFVACVQAAPRPSECGRP